MSRIVTCKICNKLMKCKQITKWQYRKTRIMENAQGDNEVVEFQHIHRRFIFPSHKKGLLFKKICDGSKVKKVFEQSDRLYTQEELDQIKIDNEEYERTYDNQFQHYPKK